MIFDALNSFGAVRKNAGDTIQYTAVHIANYLWIGKCMGADGMKEISAMMAVSAFDMHKEFREMAELDLSARCHTPTFTENHYKYDN